ncbi:uncharacterized protein LOC108049946 [Drosophila rhopaloa]|uniref:Uncharacterized protein LOC108049946 n=1 Tax=Drosophila rhopaloa TaxID=1041015 RepID=A0A6P4F9F3_DRORH|nr:uncharacterized protein LOC108049946 [Drosophila rhopaloa]
MEPNKNSEKPQITTVCSSALLNNVSSMSADSCDDLSDIELKDVPAQLETTLKPRPYEASTLFNIDLDEIWGPNSQEEALQEYKERAQKDQQKFFDFVMKSALDLGNRTVNYKPNEEQQRYLDQGPNLQNFVRGSLDFINIATRFQAEHEEMMELQDNIEDQYRFLRNNMVNNAFHQNLAG